MSNPETAFALWQLAYSILFDGGCRAVNLESTGGRAGSHTSHSGWAMDFRAYATEEEHQLMTEYVVYSRPMSDIRGVAHRFIKRVPEPIVETGEHLLEVL